MTSSPQKLCGEDASCKALEQGGLRVTTTLDVNLQKIAEKWVAAAATVPNAKTLDGSTKAAKALGFKTLEPWMAQPAQQGPPQRRAGRPRLPDR